MRPISGRDLTMLGQQLHRNIRPDQEIGRFIYAREIFARRFHGSIYLGADANKDCFEPFFEKTVNGLIFADIRIPNKLHPGF